MLFVVRFLLVKNLAARILFVLPKPLRLVRLYGHYSNMTNMCCPYKLPRLSLSFHISLLYISELQE